MVFITQVIYIVKGQEETFLQFEKLAIPIIAKYNGKLLLRIRPEEASIIELNMDLPYEIHLVQFDSVSDFDNFKVDKERKEFLHLKEKSIRSSLLIQGEKI